MHTNRRKFLKLSSLAGLGIAGTGTALANTSTEASNSLPRNRFNMSGYAAPRMDKVRVAIIGLGARGSGAVSRLALIGGVEIVALCDQYPDRVARQQAKLQKQQLSEAKSFSGSKEAWKAACELPDLDLVYITTPWSLHTPMAVYAMQQGKHAAIEVPAATTMDECWQLVETSERTRRHCMMLENCCYDFFELLTLNMARQGFFGEIVHVEGAYIHDLLHMNFSKNSYAEMWRLKENQFRNGNLYPTHGLGPVCQVLNINRGDRMDYLTSMSTSDFQMNAFARQKAAEDPFFKPYDTNSYRGNMNTSVIRTELGKTIMLQHDVTSPRPYSRIHLISGTKGMASKWPEPERIAKGHQWISDADMKKLEAEYTPEIVKHMGTIAKEIGGHGGMDFLMDWRLIDCLRNGLPLDQDVYDAALWSAIAPLSEKSVSRRSASVDVPDFTGGWWKSNKPVSLSLSGGGNTMVRKMIK